MNSSSSSGSITGNQQVLHIRSDVFEHAVFPTPAKLTLIHLVNLFGSLNQVANSEKKITLEQFKEHIQKHTTNINEKDAEIYFLTYKMVTEDDISFVIQAAKKQSTSSTIQQQQIQMPTLYADVRGLAVFFFLQLFSISARNQFSMDFRKSEFNTHFNEGFRGNLSHNFSPLNSPRSKTTRTTPQFSSEQQQAIYYIRFNIKSILKLLCNDINNEDCLLTAQDFNVLQLILKPEINQLNKITLPSSFQTSKLAQLSQPPTLSQYSGKFNVVNRVNMHTLSEYISTSISTNEQAIDVIYIQGLTKSVMCKDEKFCADQDLRILNCEDSYIYIDAAVQSLSVTNCTNTTIFISAVNKICTIDKSENLTITVASNFLRIGNTIDSTVYYYGSYYPVLYGDNRSVTLAPNNANYLDLFERMKQSKIPLNYKSSLNFASPIVMNQNQAMSYTILSTKEFFPINLPPQFKPVSHSQVQTFEQILSPQFEKYLIDQKNNQQETVSTNMIIPLLAPNDYRDQVIQRFKLYTDYQGMLKNSGLSDSQSRHLQNAIQGYFREWMVQTGQIKPISDLVKMINQD
ncbi:hypothetical protein ABPG72_001273 [Tetrahymena utriculariae]